MHNVRSRLILANLLFAAITGLTGCSETATNSAASSTTNKPSHANQPTETQSNHGILPKLGPSGFDSIHMVNPKDGWATYTHLPYQWVLRTTDGGVHWTNVTPQGSTTRGGVQAQFLTPSQAWVVVLPYEFQYNSIFNSTDKAGQTWTPSVMPGGLDTGVQTFYVRNKNEIWALMGNHLWEGVNGGASWTKVGPALGSQPSNSLPHLSQDNGIFFLTRHTGWVTGWSTEPGKPYFYQTADGGMSWKPSQIPLPATAAHAQILTTPPRFWSSSTGAMPVFFQYGKQEFGVVFTTTNGGASWKSSTPFDLGNVANPPVEVNQDGIWAVKQTRDASTGEIHCILYRETSNGWTTVSVDPLGNTNQVMDSIDFVTANIGWAIVHHGQGTILYQTHNGGKTWSQMTTKIK